MYLNLFLAGEHSPFLADWTVMCMQSQLNANTSNSSDLFLWFQITADDTCDAAYSYASCENSGYNTVLIQLPSRNPITKPEILISWAFKSLLEKENPSKCLIFLWWWSKEKKSLGWGHEVFTCQRGEMWVLSFQNKALGLLFHYLADSLDAILISTDI